MNFSRWGMLDSIRAIKTMLWHAHIYSPSELIKWLQYNKQLAIEYNEITREFLAAVQKGDEALNILYTSFGEHSPVATSDQTE